MGPRTDVVVLEENQGHLLIVGDIHGEIDLLAHVIAKLRSEDRLILVGDWVDRSPNSAAVIKLIETHNNTRKHQIFSVRGNHEDLLLGYINLRLDPDAAGVTSEDIAETEHKILSYANNYQELEAFHTFINGQLIALSTSSPLDEESIAYREMQNELVLYAINGGSWAFDPMNLNFDEDNFDENAFNQYNEKLIAIKNQIEPLPYIIYVKGERPCFIVHAARPISVKKLLERINKLEPDLQLNALEKKISTWARINNKDVPLPFHQEDTGLGGYIEGSFCFPFTYCGHSIYEDPKLRLGSGHINIDFGSFLTKHICIVNHTTANCVVYTTKPTLEDTTLEFQATINNALKILPKPTTTLPDLFKNEANLKREDVAHLVEGVLTTSATLSISEATATIIYDSLLARVLQLQNSPHKPNFFMAATVQNAWSFSKDVRKIIDDRLDGASALDSINQLVSKLKKAFAIGTDAWATTNDDVKSLGYVDKLERYIIYLNQHPQDNHFTRLAGVLLRDFYQTYDMKTISLLNQDAYHHLWSKMLATLTDNYHSKALSKINENQANNFKPLSP